MEREEAKRAKRRRVFSSKVNGEISLSKGFFTFYASAEDKAVLTNEKPSISPQQRCRGEY